MRLFAIISLSVLLSYAAYGQDESRDSIAVTTAPDALWPPDSIDIYYEFDKRYAEAMSHFSFAPTSPDSLPDFAIEYYRAFPTPGLATVSQWRNGSFYATGGVETFPGLMAINSGAINIDQTFGNLSVHLFGSATKYGFFRGLETSYGVGGTVSYRFNDKLSATIFGEYHSGVRLNSPAMLGYVRTTCFGGFIDYSFSDKFGVEVGAQGYRSMMTGRVEAQPIVKPYYRMSKNCKIGVDVGGILYQVLRNANTNYNVKNPTMGPPVQKLSQMMGY